MNILLSAYSCNPYNGSEDGIGWQWALQLEKNWKSGDRIILITKQFNEKDIRKGMNEFGIKHIELIIQDVPNSLNWFREKHSLFHHMYYELWQLVAYKWIKKSGIHFDIMHHVTMGDFRITGRLWKTKDAITIFGPVGGGQITPKSLKCYEKKGIYAALREIVNKTRCYDPFYKKRLNKFSRIYVINAETQELVSKTMGKKCDRLLEMAISDEYKNIDLMKKCQNIKDQNKKVVITYVGRLIEKKGICFLIDSLKYMPNNKNFELHIYGAGPLENRLRKMIKEYDLQKKVFLKGSLPHNEISSVYINADIFVLPSLRETSGNVLLEAMAYAVPIVAFNRSVCRDLKEKSCGLFIDTNQPLEIIKKDFVGALVMLIDNSEERNRFGLNGYRYVNDELTWEKKYEAIYGKLR